MGSARCHSEKGIEVVVNRGEHKSHIRKFTDWPTKTSSCSFPKIAKLLTSLYMVSHQTVRFYLNWNGHPPCRYRSDLGSALLHRIVVANLWLASSDPSARFADTRPLGVLR